MIHCKWLPQINECTDFNNWNEYLKNLYTVFKKDFIESKPLFDNKIVNFRKYPMESIYEHSFIHLTHVGNGKEKLNPNDRIPDPPRAARIAWPRAIIENYKCNENCINCNNIKYYEVLYKGKIRCHLLFEDVKFLVVLEKRETYNLLVTSYYLNYDNSLDKHLKKYMKYQKQKTPLI